MFGRKKKEEVANIISQLTDKLKAQQLIIRNLNSTLAEYQTTWKSPEGQIILNDFQRALNLIVAYQGSLNTLCAPDPHVVDARLLLSKYGQKGLTSGRGVLGLEEFIQTREDEEASGKLKG